LQNSPVSLRSIAIDSRSALSALNSERILFGGSARETFLSTWRIARGDQNETVSFPLGPIGSSLSVSQLDSSSSNARNDLPASEIENRSDLAIVDRSVKDGERSRDV